MTWMHINSTKYLFRAKKNCWFLLRSSAVSRRKWKFSSEIVFHMLVVFTAQYAKIIFIYQFQLQHISFWAREYNRTKTMRIEKDKQGLMDEAKRSSKKEREREINGSDFHKSSNWYYTAHISWVMKHLLLYLSFPQNSGHCIVSNENEYYFVVAAPVSYICLLLLCSSFHFGKGITIFRPVFGYS